MFSHEVIKSLRKYYKRLPKDSGAYSIVKDLTTTVWNSHKFHFGEANEITEITGINGRKKNDPNAFSDPLDHDLILPYYNCWFDFKTSVQKNQKVVLDNGDVVPISEYLDREKMNVSYKKGFFIKEDIPNSLLSSINFYNTSKNSNNWGFTPIVYFISLSKPIKMNIEACEFIHNLLGNEFSRKNIEKMLNTIKDGNIFPAPMFEADILAKNMDRQTAQIDMINLDLVEAAVRLLNCRNIVTEEINAKRKVKVGKKTKKKNLGYTYKILDILHPPTRKDYIDSEDTGRKTRKHVCRKHYRHYYDKPLFGKYYGRYLIPSHVRGSRKYGKVDKDYNVKVT